MSQQLQISSLASALALVCLCLIARVGVEINGPAMSENGAVLQVFSAKATQS
ncbi:hypothetical protein INR77_13330 [Erythrobacter sp. SCSIO 43205]|uniref:hypothetical protein n=1 Tax=Erythrobacter sp. SCSIO 43205 TaxID=2779361 RepID=UPI001CA8104F|nr:hypothetical protein [Erythrobacter sp. SCSIO 43205]UAB77748.1 hypothetical protein INR77_13330 [Erythrobacter sp. SCSIO 43205]